MLLRIPHAILQKTLSYLRLCDISILVVLCKYTKSIKKQIYESVQSVHIVNEIKVRKIVENCPKIKHVTIHVCELTDEHYNLIHQLNLESLIHDNPRENLKLSFKNLKHLNVRNLDDFNIDDCKMLEHITVRDFTGPIDKSKFPNLKSFRITHNAEFIQYDLPITELSEEKFTEEMLQLPLDTLRVSVDRSITKSLSLIARSNIKNLELTSEDNSKYGKLLNKLRLAVLLLKYGTMTCHLDIPTLQVLTLDCVNISMYALSKLVNLTELSIKKCVSEFADYTLLNGIADLRITKLSIIQCKFDLDNLARLPLKYLSITDCAFTGKFHHLPNTITTLILLDLHITIDQLNLSKLDTLIVQNTNIDKMTTITNTGLESISKLPITVLELTGCNLTDDNIGYLADMQVNDLKLRYNDLSIVGIRKLKRLPLRRLEVSDISLLDMVLF